MGSRVKLKIDSTQKILLKRSLNKNGEAQRFFSTEMQRIMNPYVPVRSGGLRRSAIVHDDSVEYNSPYARRQYYENQGNGIEGMNNGGRGGHTWDKRAWADNGDAVVDSVAAFVGGKRA